MFVEKRERQHLNMTVQVITQPLDNAVSNIIHEIGLTKVARPSQQVDNDDGKGEELQHPHVFLEEDFIQHWFYNVGCRSSHRCYQHHAQHGQEQTGPLCLYQLQDSPAYAEQICPTIHFHGQYLTQKSRTPQLMLWP